MSERALHAELIFYAFGNQVDCLMCKGTGIIHKSVTSFYWSLALNEPEYKTCPYCDGTGVIRRNTADTRAPQNGGGE